MGKAMRLIIGIPCEEETLLATLDGPADATIGWVFVIGGSQTRVGPHRLYERLAIRLAETGQAVIRFDRRGVGDSSGNDAGYSGSGPDIESALHALNIHFPNISDIFGFGLCDGASAIALVAPKLSGAVLANPWVVEPMDDLPPAAAIRGHYARRLLDLRAWRRLFGGGVNLRRLARGILRSGGPMNDSLARRFAERAPGNSRIVLADGDGTAQAFSAAWKSLKNERPPMEIVSIPTASHSFADPPASEALAKALLDYSAATASSASKSASAR
ncbi:hydrolase 1, exosortase A system-associated [Sphingomonas sp. CGMCC 1.13654]|uniref:Hydrolase 1, exosortase A system-associated n=1 Tax=Sphingomonas chungangi TaxID=2683589 RepID=A0A838LAD7_9SPHN|nr:hydrolase 1, exosortase A system-associated [Sphingomonas chungangi]MBA2935850.1 hydrolase 1, exosortase A system-associated [Sphingomonas chungangi]MVW54541.1 hydrolase 1, exosortase A system-associated [Sphingomonas chungangi]